MYKTAFILFCISSSAISGNTEFSLKTDPLHRKNNLLLNFETQDTPDNNCNEKYSQLQKTANELLKENIILKQTLSDIIGKTAPDPIKMLNIKEDEMPKNVIKPYKSPPQQGSYGEAPYKTKMEKK